MSDYIRHTWQDEEVITAEKMNNIEEGIAEAKKAASQAGGVPIPTASDEGKALVVGPDGKYKLGEAGISEVSADMVKAGTFGGMVKANPTAAADLSVAQVRNVLVGEAEMSDTVLEAMNIGDIYYRYEAVT